MVYAQTSSIQPKTTAHRITEHITIDGQLDEGDWKNAIPITQLFQIQPNEGVLVTQPSEVANSL